MDLNRGFKDCGASRNFCLVNPLSVSADFCVSYLQEPASRGVSVSSQSGLRTDRDFESLVMMRLRQAEERRRLIEQIERDHAEDS